MTNNEFENSYVLSQAEVDRFNSEGYLIFNGFFDDNLTQLLKEDVDQLMVNRATNGETNIMVFPALGPLTSEPTVVDRIADLMGTTFTHHHIHARWQGEGESGVSWHHDYEQMPQTNRSHLMVHVFIYLDGLNGEIGDLLVLPGSHQRIMARDAFRQFMYDDLPGSVTIDNLSPGSFIIVHSALQHARRPKPGGETFRRYFIDTSYCQHGILWPAGRRLCHLNQMAIDLGWDRNGKYTFLYDNSCFFDPHDYIEKFNTRNQGSLALHLTKEINSKHKGTKA